MCQYQPVSPNFVCGPKVKGVHVCLCNVNYALTYIQTLPYLSFIINFGYERGLAYRIIYSIMHTLYHFHACENIKIAKLGGAWEQDYHPCNYTRLIALNQSLHNNMFCWATGVLFFVLSYLYVEQDRVSLVPQIPQEVGYFWTEPTISPDVFSQIKIDDKGNNNSIECTWL